jgi:hypothetical protein
VCTSALAVRLDERLRELRLRLGDVGNEPGRVRSLGVLAERLEEVGGLLAGRRGLLVGTDGGGVDARGGR